MILGALPEAVDVTTTLEVQLQPDDRIVLYTDGITEVSIPGERCWASKVSGNRRPYLVSASRPNETGHSRRCGCVARGTADGRRFPYVAARSLKQMNSTLGECMAPRRTAVLVSVALLFAGIETSSGTRKRLQRL